MTATRFHWDHSPPGFNRDNTLYLCLTWNCEPGTKRFFQMLNQAAYRIARATGIPPSQMTADIMVRWYNQRYWARIGHRRPRRPRLPIRSRN